MTISMVQGVEITRPTTIPLKSSVLAHATVVDNVHFGLRNNAGLWVSYNCLDMLVPTSICPEPTETKVFGFADWMPGLEGAVYGGVQCNHVGLDAADQKREVERVFRLAEGKGVEQLLLANRFVARASSAERGGDLVGWDAPVDLTPASAIPLTVALALLEGRAADLYAGVPTLHLPRAAATVLEANGLIVWNGDRAFTKNGSKVAIGGGYDDPDMLASGEWNMYATGEVYVERAGDIDVYQFPVVPGTQSRESDDPNQFNDNTMVAMAERMFRVAVDCFVFKVTGTVWS